MSFSWTLDSPAIIYIFPASLPLAVALWLSFEQQNVSRNNMYICRFIFVYGKWLSSHFFSFLLQEVVITRETSYLLRHRSHKEDGRWKNIRPVWMPEWLCGSKLPIHPRALVYLWTLTWGRKKILSCLTTVLLSLFGMAALLTNILPQLLFNKKNIFWSLLKSEFSSS